MDRENWTYFDGTRKILDEIDIKPLLEHSGDFVALDLEYGICKNERGYNLIIVDLENEFSYIDTIFGNKEDLELRLNEIKDTVNKIIELDKKLLKSRTSNVESTLNNILR